MLEYVAAITIVASGFAFVTLVIGNYLVFSSSLALQSLGSYFLTPAYYFSVVVLHLSPFDEGLWAFVAFCLLILSLSVLRTREFGVVGSLVDSLTLVGPAILICFEIGVYFLIPSYFYAQVTNFVGTIGLGGIVTNGLVLIFSLVTFSGGILLKAVHSKSSRRGNLDS